MTKQLTVLFVVILCLGTTAFAADCVKADVPFAFMVGNHAFPAGTYIIEQTGRKGLGIVKISSRDNGDAVFSFTNKTVRKNDFNYEIFVMGKKSPDTDTEKPVKLSNEGVFSLVFNRYGSQHFLSKMWMGSKGQQFVKSSAEKEAMAASTLPTDTVILEASAR